MSKIIIGIDPDSKAHGVAVYVDGRISQIDSMTLIEIQIMITKALLLESNIIDVHIVFWQENGKLQLKKTVIPELING